MTFYLTCSQGQECSAVLMDVWFVRVPAVGIPIAKNARLNMSVAALIILCMF